VCAGLSKADQSQALTGLKQQVRGCAVHCCATELLTVRTAVDIHACSCSAWAWVVSVRGLAPYEMLKL
jgi:hypothetical protein